MNTRVEIFDGAKLLIPDDLRFSFPHPSFHGFPECCGTGAPGSMTNRLVPETLNGLCISPVCHIHDWMFGYWPKSWAAYHYANAVFLTNMLEVNRTFSIDIREQIRREPIILSYYAGVSSPIGAHAFFHGGE